MHSALDPLQHIATHLQQQLDLQLMVMLDAEATEVDTGKKLPQLGAGGEATEEGTLDAGNHNAVDSAQAAKARHEGHRGGEIRSEDVICCLSGWVPQ